MIKIVRGIPGSGKSTFAKNYFKGINHIEADQFHITNGVYTFKSENLKYAHEWCQSICAFFLNQGSDCIVSNTFIHEAHIEPYYEMAEHFHTSVEVYRMYSIYESIHGVPQDTIDKMRRSMHDIPGEKKVTFTDRYIID